MAWGDGVFRSLDGGETFEHLGLEDTHAIGRVVTHPTDPDVAYVAAVGHLWGQSGDRGAPIGSPDSYPLRERSTQKKRSSYPMATEYPR
ncbi:MAG: hypothetical protein ACKVG4_12165 [Longimicrobiales bacterium]